MTLKPNEFNFAGFIHESSYYSFFGFAKFDRFDVDDFANDFIDKLIINDNKTSDTVDNGDFINDTGNLIADKIASNPNIVEIIEGNKIDSDSSLGEGSINENLHPDIEIGTYEVAQFNTVKTNFLASLEAKIAAKKSQA